MRILGADGLTGNEKALDAISSPYLNNGDMCLAKEPATDEGSGKVYFYILKADQGGVENSPNIIVPLDNDTVPTDKRWVLTGVYQDEVVTFDIFANTLQQATSGTALVINDTMSLSGEMATFINEFPDAPFAVDSQFMVTNLNAEYWGGMHWTEFDIDVLIKSGDQWMSQGVDSVDIVFPAPVFSTTYSLFTELFNDTDPIPSLYQHMVTNKTTSGFTAKLSGETDTAYYRLQWAILGDNSYYEAYNLQDTDGNFDIYDVAGDQIQVF